MRANNIFYLILLGIATACSGPEEEPSLLPPAPVAAMQRMSFLNEAATDYTVTAFLKGEQGFAFLKTFSSEDHPGPQMEVSLPLGEYQFLFASTYGQKTLMSPVNDGGNRSLFGDMRFTVQPDPNNLTLLAESDELFLQDQKADSVYQVKGPNTIRCNLTRAVAQAIVIVKRGYLNASGTFDSIPYPSSDNLLRYLSGIEIDLNGVGTSVNALCQTSGSGRLSVKRTAAEATLTPGGFARFTGPFFLPAEAGQQVDIRVVLHPADASPMPTLTMQTTGHTERNQQMIITVWVSNDWSFTTVTVDLQPIKETIDGEQDIWDDNVTQN